MANSNGWGDGAANNAIGWGQGANNAIAWGDSHAKSWAGATDIVGLTTDPDAQAFITAAAITDATQQLAIDNLVKGLKSDNIWTKMKAIYPFVGGTASTHKWNLKDPRDLDAAFRLVFNGGWTHSSNGATPNGTNGYADTKLNDSSLTPNSSHISYYSRNNVFVSNYDMGIYNGTKGIWFALRNSAIGSGVFTGGIFQAGASGEVSVSNLDSTGYYIGGKNGSTTVKFYKNGTSVASTAKADTTATNTSIYLATLNQNGTPAFGFSTKQCAFSTIGDGLTDTEAANLYTRVQAYQTALSRQV
jgi:hypothetical protein